MAESSAMNSSSRLNDEESLKSNGQIKEELEVTVKREPIECLVCAERSPDGHDINNTKTLVSGLSLHDFLCKVAPVNLTNSENYSKFVCKTCYDLVNELERSEIEYLKLKETFDAIISKNPLFGPSQTSSSNPCTVKDEVFEAVFDEYCKSDNFDSEDEPLALTKNKRLRKGDKRKKKSSIDSKRRSRYKKERYMLLY